MRIGIDIDDTVSHTNERLIEEAYKYDKEHVKGKGFKNRNAYSFMDMFYWNVMDVDNFLKSVRNSKFFDGLNVKDSANEYITKLYNEGHKIIFITRRSDKFATKIATKKWLKKNGFKYHKLILGCKEKGNMCLNNDIDLFIDNDYKNVYDALSNGIDAILMGDDYNKDENEVKRVESWKEIYDYVNEVK